MKRTELNLAERPEVYYRTSCAASKVGADTGVAGRRVRSDAFAVWHDIPCEIDANCAWTLENCLPNIHSIKDLGVVAIEQPLPHVDFADIDGAVLLSNDPAFGAVVKNGYCQYSNLAGSGARLY